MKNKLVDFILNNRAYFEDYITRSTYHSNRIEGNTLSYAETYAIIFNDSSIPIKATARELYEAINHKYAISYMLEHINDNKLTQGLIKQLGIIINHNINEINGYRTEPVYIRGAEHLPPAPSAVPQQMMYFVYNYNASENQDVFDKAALFHLEFERIHPFPDGNGRTGRLLINYELIRHEYPPVVIPFEQRANYMNCLASQDVPALAQLLRECSEFEQQRMHTFMQMPGIEP